MRLRRLAATTSAVFGTRTALFLRRPARAEVGVDSEELPELCVNSPLSCSFISPVGGIHLTVLVRQQWVITR